jgi:hypothetical protein
MFIKVFLPFLIYGICAREPHLFDKNLPSKIGVRLIHGVLCPFDD